MGNDEATLAIERASLADLVRGGVLRFGDGYRTKRSELGASGFPILRVAQVAAGSIRAASAPEYVREEFRRAIGPKLARIHDVVLTTKGTFGRRAYVRQEDADYVYSPQVCWFRVIDYSRLDPRYLYSWIGSPDFAHQARGMKSQTDMADYLSLRDLARITVPLPPMRMQRAIATILGTLDEKIELNRRSNQTLEAMARALFRSWFVDFDPVRAKADGRDAGLPPPLANLFPDVIEESEIGAAPRGWRIGSLNELGRFLNGLALQRYSPAAGLSLPVIKIAQLRSGRTKGADRASAGIPNDYVVTDGDVLFSWSGSLECVLWAGGLGALNQHLFKVTSREYPKWFLYLWIDYHLPAFRRIAAAKATTMGHIQRRHLTEARVVVPPPALIELADRILSPLVDAIVARGTQSSALEATRDTLLPRLLSGELRVGTQLAGDSQ
jgi:type I restriction enzyme S subunit